MGDHEPYGVPHPPNPPGPITSNGKTLTTSVIGKLTSAAKSLGT